MLLRLFMTSGHKPRKNIESRIFSLIIIPSALLMIAFMLIQLTSETKTIAWESKTRAQVAAFAIQDKIRQWDWDLSGQTEDLARLKLIATHLTQNNLVDRISVLDTDGKFLFHLPENADGMEDDARGVQELSVAVDIDRSWLYSHADPKTRILNLYLPVQKQGRIAYAVKTSFSLGKIKDAFHRIYLSLLVTAVTLLMMVGFLTASLTRKIVHPLKKLGRATSEIMSGNFSERVQMDTNDEIGDLANTFNLMTEKISEMKSLAENANPLTHLPGNIAIESDVNQRIKNRTKFAVIHCDLDHFKAYNDSYGIEKGDQAIKLTAAILKSAIEQVGKQGDFLGHEGGDDFVLVTRPDRAKAIADFITTQFDDKIKNLYSEEDRSRGYLMGYDRRASRSENGEIPLTPLPFISISLAGLSNENVDFASYAEITNRLVDVKHEAKAVRGSIFIYRR